MVGGFLSTRSAAHRRALTVHVERDVKLRPSPWTAKLFCSPVEIVSGAGRSSTAPILLALWGAIGTWSFLRPVRPRARSLTPTLRNWCVYAEPAFAKHRRSSLSIGWRVLYRHQGACDHAQLSCGLQLLLRLVHGVDSADSATHLLHHRGPAA